MNIELTRLSLLCENQFFRTQFGFRSGKECKDDICHQINSKKVLMSTIEILISAM